MTISEQKATIRKEMMLNRDSLSDLLKHSYDQWMCRSLWSTISQKKYKTVHCYIPMGSEIDIEPLIDKMLSEKISVIAPKTLTDKKLQHLVMTSLEELEDGAYGTRHPAKALEYDGTYDLIIVPGLAFDKKNHRLGYGGGYYDNFMIHHTHAIKIGIFYPFQKIDNLPIEPHDICLDEIRVDMQFSGF